MKTGGRGYPQAGPHDSIPDQRSETTVVNVSGGPVFDEVVRPGEPTFSLADLLRDDDGNPCGVRGWRLA